MSHNGHEVNFPREHLVFVDVLVPSILVEGVEDHLEGYLGCKGKGEEGGGEIRDNDSHRREQAAQQQTKRCQDSDPHDTIVNVPSITLVTPISHH